MTNDWGSPRPEVRRRKAARKPADERPRRICRDENTGKPLRQSELVLEMGEERRQRRIEQRVQGDEQGHKPDEAAHPATLPVRLKRRTADADGPAMGRSVGLPLLLVSLVIGGVLFAMQMKSEGPTSPAVTQVVNPGNTTTSLTSTPNPSSFGQTVTLSATVNPVAPATGVPTGTVRSPLRLRSRFQPLPSV